MAVEAQHFSSSSLIFLNNRRNGKEEEQDFSSLQSQAEDFLDQPNMLFNNRGSNQRKRRREINNHQLPLQVQSQYPQVIDLSLLHQPPSNMVYTGLQLSSSEDQTTRTSGFLSVSSEDAVAASINRQSKELDEFLHVQAEELRRTLVEKRSRHYKALVSAVEGPLIRKLREKEGEIERATLRQNELMARDAQSKAELQAWQERAKRHQVAAASLQAQLWEAGRYVQEQDSGTLEEGLLCTAGLDDAESVYEDPERTRRPRCRCCRKGEATMVLLPCRHLSLCLECDRTTLACPVCLTLRNSSVEAILC